MTIDFEKLIADSKKLAKKIQESGKEYQAVYCIPSGGLIPGAIISEELGIPLKSDYSNRTLIVDDLIDSGKTLEKFKEYDTAVLYTKKHSPEVTYSLEEVEGWVDLPHESIDTPIEDNIVRIFEYIGENPKREGLEDTPKRVIKMYNEIFAGYKESNKPKITIFDNGADGISYDQMITDTGNYYSHCEHHMVPFFGDYYFAYIPAKDGKILGLSKVARIVDFYSAKLQIQERLVQEIVDELWKALSVDGCEPVGMALVMKGKHLCKSMRGVKKDGFMTTSALKGAFKDNKETREEFFNLFNLK